MTSQKHVPWVVRNPISTALFILSHSYPFSPPRQQQQQGQVSIMDLGAPIGSAPPTRNPFQDGNNVEYEHAQQNSRSGYEGSNPAVTHEAGYQLPSREIPSAGPAPEPVSQSQSPPPIPPRMTQDPHPATASHATASHPSDPTAPNQTPTSTINPDIPSAHSAPTALPTNPSTHPSAQKDAINNASPALIKREVEKTKGAERELKGEAPLGTIVKGLEDDRLHAMLRMFDRVCAELLF